MPEFFPFIPGTETGRAARQYLASDASPLLGRFRAVPPARSQAQQQLGLFGRGSVHVGYGALVFGSESDSEDDDEDGGEDDRNSGDNSNDNNGRGYSAAVRRTSRILRRVARLMRRNIRDLWVAPRQTAVKRVVERWWSRWGVLVFLPAALVSSQSRFLPAFYSLSCCARYILSQRTKQGKLRN